MIYSLVVWCFASTLFTFVQSQTPDQNVYSLASFDQNQATDLTPACNDVYTAVIPGCSAPDFLPTNACSANCINGLFDIQTEAQAACANNLAPPNSMLMFFTNGNGVQEMCTVQKSLATNPQSGAAQTTLATSVVPPTTVQNSATSTISTAQLASQAAAGQTNTALSQGAIIGIVVAIVVVVALMAVVVTCLRWKNYSNG